MIANHKISILCFPQAFKGDTLTLRTVILPRVNPMLPLDGLGGIEVPYINANIQLRARLFNDPDKFPVTTAVAGPGLEDRLAGTLPANRGLLYNALAKQFEIVDDSPDHRFKKLQPGESLTIKKYLPESYRSAFPFVRPRTPFCVTDDSFHCAIKNPRKRPDKDNYQQSPDGVTWSKAFAWCLNNYHLCEQMGLIVESTIPDVPAGFFENGGWVYIDLDPSSDYAALPDTQRSFAARIPAITEDRSLFAPILFPVAAAEPAVSYDDYLREAAAYDDGFCKIMHCAQPVSQHLLEESADQGHQAPLKDLGIRLGWDDEQVAIWLNRSISGDPNKGIILDESPQLGVFQYRVDVREVDELGDPVNPILGWTSLTEVNYSGPKNHTLEAAMDNFSGDLGIGVTPVQLNGDKTGDFWLPMYFTQWSGQSLAIPDDRGHQLQTEEIKEHEKYGIHKPGKRYTPIGIEEVSLTYGHRYEFRTRLSDVSGGGPSKKSDPANSAQAPTASCQFKRYVRPKPLEILNLQQEVNPVNPQTSYQVRRPRLGYPALLFTEFGPTKAFDLLMQDRTQVRAINEAQKNEAVPNINREYGWYDPDVVAVEIQVEVKTLGMDNLESAAALLSRSGAETALTQTPAANKGNFIHLYTTTRPLSEVNLGDPESLGEILNLDVKYMDVPVLRFAKTDPAWIDAVFKASAKEGSVLLPTARDIRITLTPIGRPDPSSAYFGAAWAQRGLPLSFDIRSASRDERALFTHKVGEKLNPADVWRSIYLQADAFPTSNQTEQQKASGNAQQSPGDMVQRLAHAIGLDAKGMSLIAKPGQRAIFSAAKEIRNTLAPDNSSITFATKADLTDHWLSVLSLTLQRDWNWDALHVEAFEIQRRQKNTHDKTWTEWQRVGNIQLSNTLNVNALDLPGPDRGYTKLYFIDAIDPKKQAPKDPDTLELEYKVAANFKTGQKPKNLPKILHLKNMTLPVTIPPVQIPKIISAGIALSPYKRSDDYSASEQRQRALWIEFEEPIAHEEDTYFARVLAYGPDPVMTNDYIKDNPPIILPSGVPIIIPDEPGLPIDPEWIRAIFPDQAHDQAGMGIMQEMIPAQVAPGQAARHYLLPLPPGLNADSRELFGFFTYEFRVGHKDIWSTARGRYGAELRLAGVQHPAPELSCTAAFGQKTLDVFAPFAVPVHKGRSPNFIKTRENHEWQLETTLWALLYAQAHQADGQDFRNILLGEKPMELYFTRQANDGSPEGIPKDPLGSTLWERAEIQGMLRKWGLPPDAPLSVLVVEMLPTRDGGLNRPLSVNLGMERILRTSPLTVVEGVCCLDC